MGLNLNHARDLLQDFDFPRLFIEELGWANPSSRQAISMDYQGEPFSRRQIAQLAGVAVFEITAPNGRIPDGKTQAALHKQVSAHHHENLLIFIDGQRTQSLWYWVKRDGKHLFPRFHLYVKGQPGDLFLSNLNSMVVDISELDDHGDIGVVEIVTRLKKALDVERVTKKFYVEFDSQRLEFTDLIQGIDDERDRHWYASVLLNRLMFIYFLQRKSFIDNGNTVYLQQHLAASQARGTNLYYTQFLKVLFFEGFAKPEDKRTHEAKALLGKVRYLNGGLFLPHNVEENLKYHIDVPDVAFENLFNLFASYSWNLNDTPSGNDKEINPDVLGYIFEKYINQKAFGAYYTRTEITEYLCEQTVYRLVLEQVNTAGIPGVLPYRRFESVPSLLMGLDAPLCRQLLFDVLPKLKLLDPACGSGAFLVAAMKTLINLYTGIIGRIEFLGDKTLTEWLAKTRLAHPSLAYFIKRSIITDNLFGVDIMDEATEIARLRLFLALVASVETADHLEPLPNIDFNVLPGNSLIGLLRIDEKAFDSQVKQGHMFQKSYHQLVEEKRRQLDIYRHTTKYSKDLQSLRDAINESRRDAYKSLNDLELNEFGRLGIKYEQAIWDAKTKSEGKPIKRAVRMPDIEELHPFHWGYEFDEVMNTRGGFDAIITNPPWEIFKPNAKEFFEEYSDLVTKKKMTIKEFEKEQAKLLQDPDIRSAWLKYLSGFPHVSAFYRSAEQFKNQISIVDGKKTGTDINLYKLFVEQCFNLLRKGGYCGIVIPSGIYTDLGTKQLREMLFGQTSVTGLFGFENRKEIFEGVHRSFKFVVLTFEKGNTTSSFPAAFMRHDVEELERFPQENGIEISVGLIRRLSPDSLSVMEFKSEMDVRIAEKMLKFPLIGEEIPGKLNLKLSAEFHMTNDSYLFKTQKRAKCLTLFEGKMMWQFEHQLEEPRYWVDENEGRIAILGKNKDYGQSLDYQQYRLAYRSIASSTNERSFVCTIIPRNVFAGHSLNVSRNNLSSTQLLYAAALLNSFVFDYSIRQKISANLTLFFIYQSSMPRIPEADPAYVAVVKLAAQLTCTTPEFDELAKEAGLKGYQDGVTEPNKRAKIRSELDAMIARLYDLTEEEFAHVLSTFPLVPEKTRKAALEAYKALIPKSADVQLVAEIVADENLHLEHKSSARWDLKQNRINKELEHEIVKTCAAFMNSEGGVLFVGVNDQHEVLGLDADYRTLNKPNRDGFQNWLMTLLLNDFGKEAAPLIQCSFPVSQDKEICRVMANPSPKPVYVKKDSAEHLYIRVGNSTRLLTTREAVEYCRQHWSKLMVQ